MKVKICGITNIEDALFVLSIRRRRARFYFLWKESTFHRAGTRQRDNTGITGLNIKSRVFVNEEINRVNGISKITGLNMVQLHGDEPPSYIDNINLPAIKSFRIQNGLISHWPDTI